MADEREGADTPKRDAKVQSGGRKTNAQPLDAASDRGAAERYPPADRTDCVRSERRSFDPSADAPTPPQGDGDGATGYFTGPHGDPVEGKR